MNIKEWLQAHPGEQLRLTLFTLTGTELHITTSRESIEACYGDVNTLVATWLKPLDQVDRIILEVFDNVLEEKIAVTTYDHRFETWRACNAFVRITQRYYGHRSVDIEEGYLERIPGWLPLYGLRGAASEDVEPIFTDSIVSIEPLRFQEKQTASEVVGLN